MPTPHTPGSTPIPPSLRQLPEEQQMAIYAELQKQPIVHVRDALRTVGVETDLAGLYGFSAWWRARLRFLEAWGKLQALAECMAGDAGQGTGARPPIPADSHTDSSALPPTDSLSDASAPPLTLTPSPTDTSPVPDSPSPLILTLEQVEAWGDFLFLQTAVAEDNLEGYVKLRGIMERARRTRLDERRMALLEARAARLEHAGRERQESGGGLSPETLELMESMLGMMQS